MSERGRSAGPGGRSLAWWGEPDARPFSVAELIATGMLDAQLAALVWLMVEGRTPLLVTAGPRLVGKTTTLTAFLDFLAHGIETREIRGRDEDFDWQADPLALGWPGADVADLLGSARSPDLAHEQLAGDATSVLPPDRTYLLCAELSSHTPWYTWGLRARVLVRALQLGYGLGATMHAESLGDVFEQLSAPPVSLTEDEIRRLGVVLILKRLRVQAGERDTVRGVDEQGTIRRVVATHYLRPVERDGEGHLQHRPPIALATWNAERDEFDHFAWGATPELALRVGRSQAEFEREVSLRAAFLREVASAGRTTLPAFRAALSSYRGGGSAHTHTHPAN